MYKTSVTQKISMVLFGLFLCAVLLEIAMRIGGFVISSLQEYRNFISITQRGQYLILCLGESTTAAAGKNSYPFQLEEILNQRNTGIKFSVINKGKSGTNTALILSELEENLDKYSPDMVITMMGINDEKGREFLEAYAGISTKKSVLLLKSFRVYKLIEMLGLRLRNKLQELRLLTANRNTIKQAQDLSAPLFFPDVKELLKSLMNKNPKAYLSYIKFQECFASQRDYDKIEERLQKAIALEPDNAWGYLSLGQCYWYHGELDRAEEMFRKAIEIDPQNQRVYLVIGRCYINTRDYDKIEQIFKKAIALEPDMPWSYIGLGWNYYTKNEHTEAEEMFKRAIEIDPQNQTAYLLLGRCYRVQRKYAEAEDIIKRAIEIEPDNPWVYVELGRSYWSQREYDKTEKILKKAVINRCTENDVLYGMLAQFYRERGETASAQEYCWKADRLRAQYYNSMTRHNYQKLKEIVIARKIKLVCMQYPCRSIESLRMMFDSPYGVIFVDNERVFKEALEHGKYSDYFTDIFGGDFGHCTPKGNRLLAQNIADVISKRFFK